MRHFFLIKHHPRGLTEVYQENSRRTHAPPDTRTIVQSLLHVKGGFPCGVFLRTFGPNLLMVRPPAVSQAPSRRMPAPDCARLSAVTWSTAESSGTPRGNAPLEWLYSLRHAGRPVVSRIAWGPLASASRMTCPITPWAKSTARWP
jgi:hypothetical protein